jgi:DNA-binding MarR family transcriptional regulator
MTTMAEEIDRDLKAIREVVRRPLNSEIEKGDLTGPQKIAMAALVGSDGMSVRDLRIQLGLAHSTTSGIVDRLEKRGMVERQQDAKDRRVTRIVVTQAVRDFVHREMPELAIHPLVEALRRARPAEREAIANGVKTLRRILEVQS